MTDDVKARLENLERQVEMLTSQVSELSNRNDSMMNEIAELREGNSTLSSWVERLAAEAGLDHPH